MNGPDQEKAPLHTGHVKCDTEDKATEADLVELETSRSMNRENKRVLILVAVVGLFMVLAHFTPLKAWITNVQAWKAFVDELGWMAHLSFILACAIGVMIGLPRLPLCAGAGLIFGFMEGLSLSLVGSVLGSYGAFLMTRAGARRAVLARAERWPWLKKMLEKPSWLKVFWVRQMMLPGLVLNVLLGVTQVAHSTFLIGTLLGYLPLNIAFSLVGSGLGKGSLAQSLTQLLGALAVVNVVGWLVWRMARAKKA
ncbi:putative membrane protein YdjX (TVP38/TMEM64 family) [Prosthecobacter fusiformis]|uniref:TVP38/TMEM64 family membrane protein n=1 Tax=Prosthecobacter fusiformis TaxID=48464 RepID=A0A4R7RL70_9BACT|nr:VTT domain-containing protein [Prosthecobacter fusiformis]TDU66012.1 putative membrane protein YdjX (TVP38/TMEM64 family) [Prosthecobacter fusiformis]